MRPRILLAVTLLTAMALTLTGCEYANQVSEELRTGTVDLLIGTLAHFITQTPETLMVNEPLGRAYGFMHKLAMTFLSLAIAVMAIRKMAFGSTTHWVELFWRSVVALTMMGGDVVFLIARFLIRLNNLLTASVIQETVGAITLEKMVSPGFGAISVLLFSLVFLALCVRLLIEYFLRLLDILYCLVWAPIAWFYYIDPRTASKTSTWWQGLIQTIFAQFFLALKLCIFSILSYGLAGMDGGVKNWLFQVVLGISGMMFVLRTPAWMQDWTYTPGSQSLMSFGGLGRFIRHRPMSVPSPRRGRPF